MKREKKKMGAASYNDTHVTSSRSKVSQVCYDPRRSETNLVLRCPATSWRLKACPLTWVTQTL